MSAIDFLEKGFEKNEQSTSHTSKSAISETLDANKISLALLCVYLLTGLGVATVSNSWALALFMGAAALGSYLIGKTFFPDFTGYFTSLSLGLLSSQIIFQMNDNLHFNILFFIAIATLIFYADWRILLPIAGIFVIHHVIFYFVSSDKTAVESESIISSFVYPAGISIALLIAGLICLKINKIELAKKEIESKHQLLNKNLESNIIYAKEIASGNYEVSKEAMSDDVLGQSLMEMSKNLKEAAIEDEHRSWTMAGITRIAEIIRIANHDINELSNQLISYLVKYLKATQGGIFVIEEEGEQKHLELKGCYAYDRKKYLEKKVELGEGLLGQAILEKDSIYLTDLPDDYINITSGLGNSNPNSVIIIPLKTEEEIVGAMEFASFFEFEEYQRAFLEKVSESIASSIISSKTNLKTSEFLRESQILAEQLKAQEEEMRQNMEELQATQEDIQRKNIEMEKAEVELTNTKDYLDSIINAVPNPVFVKDNDLRMILVNDAYCKLNGTRREDILNKTDFDRFAREEAEIFAEKDRAVIDTNTTIANQEQFTDPTGKVRNIITTKAPFVDKLGKKYIVGSVVDITEQMALQKDLTKERYLMDALMIGSRDYIYFKDRDSKFIRVSNNMAAIFKEDDPGNLVGKTDFDYFTIEHAQPAFDDEQEIIRTGEPKIDMIEKETWEDGRVNYVSTTKMPLKHPNGEIVGTFGISRDVTRMVESEEGLAHKEHFYKSVLQNLSEAITVIEESGNIKFQSESFFKIFGWEENDVLGKSLLEIVHPEDLNIVQNAINKTSQTPEELVAVAFRIKDSKNNLVTVKATLNNKISDDVIGGIIIISTVA